MDAINDIEFNTLLSTVIFIEIFIYSIFLLSLTTNNQLSDKEKERLNIKIKLMCVEYFVLLTINLIFIRVFYWMTGALCALICLSVAQMIRYFVFRSDKNLTSVDCNRIKPMIPFYGGFFLKKHNKINTTELCIYLLILIITGFGCFLEQTRKAISVFILASILIPVYFNAEHTFNEDDHLTDGDIPRRFLSYLFRGILFLSSGIFILKWVKSDGIISIVNLLLSIMLIYLLCTGFYNKSKP
jgi:hypothetical protein